MVNSKYQLFYYKLVNHEIIHLLLPKKIILEMFIPTPIEIWFSLDKKWILLQLLQ